MSKVVESLVKDAVEKVKTPEFHSKVVAPLLAYLWDMVSPYFYMFVGLLVLMVVGILANLGFLVYITT